MPNMPTMLSIIVLLFFVSTTLTEEYKVTKQVYLDVQIGHERLGRIVIGLFGEIVPKTVSNFYTIATKGIDGKTFMGTRFHRVINRFMIQGGDIVHNNGSGSVSIYGKSFNDEGFEVSHSKAGVVSMANAGPHSNGCQFFITTIETSWLDGNHVAFGMVIKGQNLVHKIEHLKTDVQDRPVTPATIIKSGAIRTSTPFYVSSDPYAFNLLEILKGGAAPLIMSILILTFFHYVLRKLKRFENLKIHPE